MYRLLGVRRMKYQNIRLNFGQNSNNESRSANALMDLAKSPYCQVLRPNLFLLIRENSKIKSF